MSFSFDSAFGAKFPRPDHKIWQECPELDESQVFAAVAGATIKTTTEMLYRKPVFMLLEAVKAGSMESGYYLRLTGDDSIVLTKVGPRGGFRDVWKFGNSSKIREGLRLACVFDSYQIQAAKHPHGFKY